MEDSISKTPKERCQSLLNVLPVWLQIIIGLVTLGGFIVAVINHFNPFGNVDLTLWVQQEAPIPSEIASGPLVLKYKEERISRATVLKLKIFNSGSTPLGNKEQWTLTIKSDKGSEIIMLASPKSRPANIAVKIIEGGLVNSLTLQIGLLNPRDSIELELMVTNPLNIEHPNLVAETRIPYLTEPIVTRETLQDRLTKAYKKPILIFFWVLSFVGLVVLGYYKGFVKSPFIPTQVFICFVFSGFGSYLIAVIVTWILVKLVSP